MLGEVFLTHKEKKKAQKIKQDCYKNQKRWWEKTFGGDKQVSEQLL